MATPKFFGINEIIDVYEKKRTTPHWALYEGKTLHANYVGDDYDESIDELKYELEIIKRRDERANKATVIILHPQTKKLVKGDTAYCFDNKKYPIAYPIYCTVLDKYEAIGNVGGAGYPALPSTDIYGRLNVIESTQAQILSELKKENDEESENDESATQIGQVNELLNNPLIQSIAGLIIGYLSRGTNAETVTKLAGINQDWQECVQILFSKGVTLEHLQKLAAMPEKKIQMLLSML